MIQSLIGEGLDIVVLAEFIRLALIFGGSLFGSYLREAYTANNDEHQEIRLMSKHMISSVVFSTIVVHGLSDLLVVFGGVKFLLFSGMVVGLMFQTLIAIVDKEGLIHVLTSIVPSIISILLSGIKLPNQLQQPRPQPPAQPNQPRPTPTPTQPSATPRPVGPPTGLIMSPEDQPKRPPIKKPEEE